MRLVQNIFLSIIIAFSFTACKKDKPSEPTPTPPPPVVSRADLTKDSLFFYAKEVYLWYDALPTYEVFNPRGYNTESTDSANFEKELYGISLFKINPATGKPYEYSADGPSPKYSFISNDDNKNPTGFIQNQIASVDLEGNGNDFGLRIQAYRTSNNTDAFVLFVLAIDQNSPADKAGIVRSNRITKVNGRTIGSSFAADRNFMNTAINASSITLEGYKYKNGDIDSTNPYSVTLNKAVYKSSPIYANKIFKAGTKKIGYFAFARFSSTENAKPGLDSAFRSLKDSGITDLIVDLRYNGGGYVSTAEYLLNLIAPTSTHNQVMFASHYNTLMQTGKAPILKNQILYDDDDKPVIQNGRVVTYADLKYDLENNTKKFSKSSGLDNVQNIVFIVTDNTASASELVINSLKPYMNVKIVGEKSYGKPVGFFPITIDRKYKVYYSMFETKNSRGEGGYYDGFTPDVVDTDAKPLFDNPRYNFGNANETFTAAAIELLAPGVTVSGRSKNVYVDGRNMDELKPIGRLLNNNGFIGMIGDRPKIGN